MFFVGNFMFVFFSVNKNAFFVCFIEILTKKKIDILICIEI